LLVVPPHAGGTALPLVVMLHGAGSDPGRALPLLESAADRHGVILLAPASVGVTWDVLVGGFGADVEMIDDALAHLFAEFPVDPDRVAIGGFSDGASYALSLGFANGDLFGHILAFSPGFAVPPVLVGRPRVFVSHGTEDRVLPIDLTSRRLVPDLQSAGYDVRYDEFAAGHAVPPPVVEAAFEWFLAPSYR